MLNSKLFLFFVLLRSVCGMLNITCEDLCLRIICQEVECKNSERVENGSVCGCCPICASYIEEGKKCESDPENGTSKTPCRPGLVCENSICSIADNSNCWKFRRWREKLIKDSELSPDAWIPSCDRKSYKSKQCKQHKCFCFGNNGERIFGQANKQMDRNMTCGCSLTLFEQEQSSGIAWNTEPHEHCTLNGNYQELQCVRNVCYCCDPISGKHIGQVVLIQNITLLPCYDVEKHKKSYLTKCEEIVQRTQLITYQFALKGVELIGLKDVICDYDGSFSKKQCLTNRCFCTDRNGKSFKSYSSEKANIKTPMLCNCARDEYDIEFISAHYPRLECSGNTGNYHHHQIVEENQFCVDEDGEILNYENSENLPEMCIKKQSLALKIDDGDGGGDDDYGDSYGYDDNYSQD